MNMNTRNKDAALVVFSGGQDSTTCLLWALKRYKEVVAVSFDYGQRHKAELDCAKEITEIRCGMACDGYGITESVSTEFPDKNGYYSG